MTMDDRAKASAIAVSRRLAAARCGREDIAMQRVAVEEFVNDGYSGSEMVVVRADWVAGEASVSTVVIGKKWQEHSWVSQLLGNGMPVERLLCENGFIKALRDETSLRVPILGSSSSRGQNWVFLEDVSRELAAWKRLVSEAKDLACDQMLVEQIARFHARMNAAPFPTLIRNGERWLVSQDTRVRWFETMFNVWFGDLALTDIRDATKRKEIEAQQRFRVHYETFLGYLCSDDRDLRLRQMKCRDRLANLADSLPKTLIHGDLVNRNIGISSAESPCAVTLIDWELASIAAPAFELMHYLGRFLRPVSAEFNLLELYRRRYCEYGGESTDQDVWEMSCDIAIAHYAVTAFPAFAGMAIAKATSGGEDLVGRVIDRAKVAFRNIDLYSA